MNARLHWMVIGAGLAALTWPGFAPTTLAFALLLIRNPLVCSGHELTGIVSVRRIVSYTVAQGDSLITRTGHENLTLIDQLGWRLRFRFGFVKKGKLITSITSDTADISDCAFH